MNLATVIIVALATWEILEIWRHSSIMAPWRDMAELYDNKFVELLRCNFCLAPWTAFACGCCIYSWWPFTAAVYALAAARLANLGNDLTHTWCRTPKFNSDVNLVSTPESEPL